MGATNVNQTDSQLHVDHDVAKIFLGENRYATGTYTNSTGSEVTLAAGTLLGRVSGTEKLLPLASAATDDSNIPLGILSHTVTVANGADKNLTFAVEGDIAEELVIFQGSDGFATVVADRTLRDRIGADTVGIKLVSTTENTIFDNQ
jgi:hypothetical protein